MNLEEVSLTKCDNWRFLAPSLPQHIIQNEVTKLFRRIRGATEGAVTTIAGKDNMSGCGKSTMAAALKCDHEANAFFTGGIFWFYIGELYNENEILGALKLFCMMYVQSVKYAFEDRSVLFDICRDLEHMDSAEDVALLLHDIYSYQNKSNVHPVLIIIDDVWNDRVVRLLRPVGFSILATTRWPELFSEGQFPGSIFYIEPNTSALQASVENRFKLSRLQRLIDVCSSHIMALTLLQRIVISIGFFEQTLQRFLSSVYYHKTHNEWILRHGSDDFVSLDVRKHMCAMLILSAALDLLSSATQCYYLMLVLLPRSFVITPTFLQYYWRLESLDIVSRVLDRLLAVGLLDTMTSDNTYRLHTIHYEFLSLLTLKLHEQRVVIETPWQGQTPVSEILIGTAERYILLLTSHKYLLSGHHACLYEYFILWKRFNSLATLSIIPVVCPIACYQQEILRMLKSDPDPLMRYLEAICYISDGLSLWQQDGATLVLWHKMLFDYYHRSAVSHMSLQRQAFVLNRLGVLHRLMGNTRDAMDLHIQALMVFQAMQGNDASKEKDVCYTLRCMAEVYVLANNRDEAIKLLDSLIRYKFELFDGKHPSIGDLYTRLGDVHSMNACCSEAKVYYTCAYDMYALCLGQNHFTTVLAKAVLGASYISEGDSEEGRKLIQDAVTWLLHHGYAADHPIVDKYSKLLSEKQVQKTVIANGIRSILLCVTKDE